MPNIHSDRNGKEPGSMAWQSEHILMCSDGISSHCPHLREAHPCIPRASTVLLPSRMPHTRVLHPRGLSQTSCDDCAVTTDESVLWPPCHRAWLFGVAVRVRVWHPVDPGSSPGGVTTLSLRYISPIWLMILLQCMGLILCFPQKHGWHHYSMGFPKCGA